MPAHTRELFSLPSTGENSDIWQVCNVKALTAQGEAFQISFSASFNILLVSFSFEGCLQLPGLARPELGELQLTLILPALAW